MPKDKFPGKTISTDTKIIKKKLSFEKIYMLNLNNKFIKPNYQGSLDQDKIEQMYNSYLKNPHYLKFKDNIIIGVINNKFYIIDGQHRYQLAIKLFEEKDIEDYLIFCYYELKDEREACKLYEELNKDSSKNKLYIDCSLFEKIRVDQLKKILKLNCQEYFAKRKSKRGKKYCIEEFIDELIKISYIKKFNNAKQIFIDLINKNNIFYKECRYEIEFNKNKNIFYVDEGKNITDKFIMSLKGNNFIDYLIFNSDKNFQPFHRKKMRKKTITRKIRLAVWSNYYSNKLDQTHICPIRNCRNKITVNDFSCGHIISEYNGGDVSLKNLKPLCKPCNSAMGSNNWFDYEKNIFSEEIKI